MNKLTNRRGFFRSVLGAACALAAPALPRRLASTFVPGRPGGSLLVGFSRDPNGFAVNRYVAYYKSDTIHPTLDALKRALESSGPGQVVCLPDELTITEAPSPLGVGDA